MSTIVKTFFLLFAVIFAVNLFAFSVFSQDLELKLTVKDTNTQKVFVEGKLSKGHSLITKNWSFLRNYADVSDLGARIKDIRLFGTDGKKVSYRKFAEGEFVAEDEVSRFLYEVDAAPLEDETSASHVSWVKEARGLLMLNDLLPQFSREKNGAEIAFDLPKGWGIFGGEKHLRANTYLVSDLDNAVFLVGADWREESAENENFSFAFAGKWQFEDKKAVEMADAIFREYENIFKKKLDKKTNIFLLPFPQKTENGRWRAETRGSNIVIISSPMNFKNLAEQRLHEQLRHEIFHLWIPNNLNLSGNYAWFYEGFGVYQALKTGVWLGQIRFEDFLSTLEQAVSINRRSGNSISLIEASKKDQAFSASFYTKGMLVAFLIDTALLERSKGKRAVSEIFRRVLKDHGKNSAKTNANDAILALFERYDELSGITSRYIKGSEKIDLEPYLERIGLEQKGSEIAVKEKLSGRQKALLEKLGYNRWRKFIRNKN